MMSRLPAPPTDVPHHEENIGDGHGVRRPIRAKNISGPKMAEELLFAAMKTDSNEADTKDVSDAESTTSSWVEHEEN